MQGTIGTGYTRVRRSARYNNNNYYYDNNNYHENNNYRENSYAYNNDINDNYVNNNYLNDNYIDNNFASDNYVNYNYVNNYVGDNFSTYDDNYSVYNEERLMNNGSSYVDQFAGEKQYLHDTGEEETDGSKLSGRKLIALSEKYQANLDNAAPYGALFADPPILGPAGQLFTNIRDQAGTSCTISGYGYTYYTGPTPTPADQIERITMFTMVKDGVTLPAYCLHRNRQNPVFSSSYSTSIQDALAGVSASDRCAVAWLLMNGWSYDSDIVAWFGGLSVAGLTTTDAYFVTQVAIYWFLLHPPSIRFTMCDGSDNTITIGLNMALSNLIALASAAGCGGMAYGVPCKAVAFPHNVTMTACRGNEEYIKKLEPYSDEHKNPYDFKHVEDESLCGCNMQPISRDGRHGAWRHILIHPEIEGCGAGKMPISICFQDSPDMNWTDWPVSQRIICGKLLVGPFQFGSVGIMDDIDIQIVKFCDCGSQFTYSFADECGDPIDTPTFGEKFYLNFRILSRFFCFEMTIKTVGLVKQVYFVDNGSLYQGLGGRVWCRRETDDGFKMRVCISIKQEDEPLPWPTPAPIIYPRLPDVPGPVIPPCEVNPPPIILPAPQAPQYIEQPEPRQVLIAPPLPTPPARVIDMPPVVVPPPPAPPPMKPTVITPPVLVGRPNMPLPPRLLLRRPVVVSMPPLPRPPVLVVPPPVLTREPPPPPPCPPLTPIDCDCEER